MSSKYLPRAALLALFATPYTFADDTASALLQLAEYQAQASTVSQHLEAAELFENDVFNSQEWERVASTHAENVKVHWPDGHITVGLEAHIHDLKGMFVYAPDTEVESRQVTIGQGQWTSVVSTLEGTFTEPMPTGNGQVIEPTGKRFKLNMVTMSHWDAMGMMDEKYLFWDNYALMKQLGLVN